MNRQSTRRGFLGTLGALAGAAPLALAGAGAAKSPAKPAKPPESHDAHDPRDADMYLCNCRDCRADHIAYWAPPALLNALVACQAAITALDRFSAEHCGEWCDTCLDADACRHVLAGFINSLDSAVCGPNVEDFRERMELAEVADTTIDPYPAAVVALYDVMDALLDVTASHRHDREVVAVCTVCGQADSTVYFVKLGVEMLACGARPASALSALACIAERELLSVEGKVARLRTIKRGDGRELPPHSAAAHYGARQSAQRCREYVAMLGGLTDRKAKG